MIFENYSVTESCHLAGRLIELHRSNLAGKRRITVDGKPVSMRELARIIGISPRALTDRITCGKHSLEHCILPASHEYWDNLRRHGAAMGAASQCKKHSSVDKFMIGDRTPLKGAEAFSAKWLKASI